MTSIVDITTVLPAGVSLGAVPPLDGYTIQISDTGPPGRGISSITVDGSNHLIVHFSDSTTTDLGALPSGTSDSRLQDATGLRHVRLGDPFAQNNRTLDFWVDFTGGAHIGTPDSVSPTAATFAADAADPNVVHGFRDSGGGLSFEKRTDGLWHTFEPGRRIVVPGDSMCGVGTVKAENANLSAALGHPIFNEGISGDLEQWIDARIGARPAAVTVLSGRTGPANCGTIASTGDVNISVSPQLGANTNPTEAWICGIRGIFTPTELPGSPDPLAASDPGSIAFNYSTGVFRRRDQGGPAMLVPDGTPLQTGRDQYSGVIYARHWWLIQPSRHNFARRYQKLTIAGGSTGSVVLSLGTTGTLTGSVAWDPANVSLGAVTFTAATNRVTFSPAHGLAIGEPIVFTSVTAAAPITAGTVYFVHSVPTSTTVTLVGADPTTGDLDITADGSATGSALTATGKFARNLAAALTTALSSGWTGTVDTLTSQPGQTATVGQVQIDWGNADSPTMLVLISTTGPTVTLGHLRTGLEDTVSGVGAMLDFMSDDGRQHATVLDLGPFPGEEDGTTKRGMLDACNAALAEAFGDKFYPLWALMRNSSIITRAGMTPTAGDTTAINTTRMTPPTLLDIGGYTLSGTYSGGHPGPVGAVARRLLLTDRWTAMPTSWIEAV